MERDEKLLIALMLGELDAAEVARLEARIATEPGLQQQRDRLVRQLAAIRALPVDDAPPELVKQLLSHARAFHEEPESRRLARVITLRSVTRVYLPRIAAALVFAGLVALGVMYTPDGPLPSVGTVLENGLARTLTDGELVEAPIGSPVQVRTATGEVWLDGGAALRLLRSGSAATPVLELDRGRALVSATRAPATMHVGAQVIELERGTVLHLDYDREHARILDSGAVVEIQRTPIERVVEIANRAYDLELDASRLPEAVRRQRITFFGTQLDGAAFVRGFSEAASRFGVSVEGSQIHYHPGTTLRIDETEGEEVLNLDLLQGGAIVAGELRIGGREGAHSLALTPSRVLTRDASHVERACVWALGMGNDVVDARLGSVQHGAGTLPAGTVIYPNRQMILPEGEERIFVLDGPDAYFPLPGGLRGRLVGLISSGAEFELENSVVRVFVPHSRVTSRD
jgi:anti-sigma factor RsiW